jgi:hypothetical protein
MGRLYTPAQNVGVERGSRRHILKKKKVRFPRTRADRPGSELGNTVASVDSELGPRHESRGITGEEDNGTLHAHKRQSSPPCHQTSITDIQILWLSHLSKSWSDSLKRVHQSPYPSHRRQTFPLSLTRHMSLREWSMKKSNHLEFRIIR